MIEQLPLLLATPIAKIMLDKFYEGLGAELAKQAVETLPSALQAKIQQLGQLVWGKCLRGKPETDKLLQAAADPAAANSVAAQAQLSKYLGKVLETDAALQQAVKKLADEIHLEFTQIEDNSSMTQNNYGHAIGYQIKQGGGTAYIGTNHFHGKSPEA